MLWSSSSVQEQIRLTVSCRLFIPVGLIRLSAKRVKSIWLCDVKSLKQTRQWVQGDTYSDFSIVDLSWDGGQREA